MIQCSYKRDSKRLTFDGAFTNPGYSHSSRTMVIYNQERANDPCPQLTANGRNSSARSTVVSYRIVFKAFVILLYKKVYCTIKNYMQSKRLTVE